MQGDEIFKWWCALGLHPEGGYDGPFDSRAEAICHGQDEFEGAAFTICEADKVVPRFNVFDAEKIVFLFTDHNEDCWSEDGPPDFGITAEQDRDLEQMLTDAFKAWDEKHGKLRGWAFCTMRNVEEFQGADAS